MAPTLTILQMTVFPMMPSLLSRSSSSRVGCAVVLTSLVFAFSAPFSRAEEPALKLKDNDVWVMAGDSITAQRLHTNYIEAYYRTRYPSLKLHFRNSGISGNRADNVLARFDYDVAAWKPTIVSVELGMNDVGGSQEKYIKGMKDLIDKIRAIPAQPVLISSSPVNDGSSMGDWKSPRCQNLDPFTEALQQLAKEENVVFVDQYHPLLDLWGQNARKGAAAAAKANQPMPEPTATPNPSPAQAPSLAGAAKPAPQKGPALPPSLIPLGGNPVHPGMVGQYNMAATILTGLKADGAVSSATISAEGKLIQASHCKITGLAVKDGKISFTRLDETNPWPISKAGEPALKLLPETLKLSQYLLRIPGLADGVYRVAINGKPAGTVSAKELSGGWNLTTVFEGALAERADKINGLIAALEGNENNSWRTASKAGDATALAVAEKKIEETEAQLQAAIQPVPLTFEIGK